jgi:hypothetical protein
MNMKGSTSFAAVFFVAVILFPCCTSSSQVVTEGEPFASVVARITEGAESDVEKMKRIYYFVRDEIEFGWVYPQDIPAEQVLWTGRGVCMQKCNLLVSMAREAGLEARFHFMYVHKTALQDFLPGYAYKNWVDPFAHTFPEIRLNGEWVPVEATIDRELHEIALEKDLNFARYPEIRNAVDIEFSPKGVVGHQQYVHAEGMESFYGEDISEFAEYLHAGVPWWKRMLQPKIFHDAQRILDELRREYREESE